VRWVAVILSLVASQVVAEQVALDFYNQCTGPAIERQALSRYDGLDCHATGSCRPFELIDFVDAVESSCFATAADICSVYPQADACVVALTEVMSERTREALVDFPSERIERAIEVSSPFQERLLRQWLDEGQLYEIPSCAERRMFETANVYGVSVETMCRALQTMVSQGTAHSVMRSVLAIEAEQE